MLRVSRSVSSAGRREGVVSGAGLYPGRGTVEGPKMGGYGRKVSTSNSCPSSCPFLSRT